MTESNRDPRGALTARLDAGPVICAEGFLFELERRGYLSAGEFVPEVALEYPDALRTLHVDYQRPARTSSRRSPTTGTARRCGSSARRTCWSR